MWQPISRNCFWNKKKRARGYEEDGMPYPLPPHMMSKPNTEALDAETLCMNGMEIGHSAIQGYRVTMEDAHIIDVLDPDAATAADMGDSASSSSETDTTTKTSAGNGALSALPDHTFLAMLDGHAGDATSLHVSARLTDILQATEQYKQYVQLLNSNKLSAAARKAKKSKKEVKGSKKGLAPSTTSTDTQDFTVAGIYVNTPEEIKLLSTALVQAYVNMDEELLCNIEHISISGSTAVCIIITPSHIVCANVGDSRCYIGTKHSVIALTDDHKPSLPEEEARIIAAGAFVSDDRVNGELAMSRALGDFQYKKNNDINMSEQAVNCYPDISIYTRNYTIDNIIILACDGIWDVMNGLDACNFITDIILKNDSNILMQDVCRNLVLLALRLGSGDNISAIIVNLNPIQRPQVD